MLHISLSFSRWRFLCGWTLCELARVWWVGLKTLAAMLHHALRCEQSSCWKIDSTCWMWVASSVVWTMCNKAAKRYRSIYFFIFFKLPQWVEEKKWPLVQADCEAAVDKTMMHLVQENFPTLCQRKAELHSIVTDVNWRERRQTAVSKLWLFS